MFGNEFDPSGGAQVGMSLAAQGKMARMPTATERAQQAVLDAEERLKDAKRALEILKANPELEELLNILQKGRF